MKLAIVPALIMALGILAGCGGSDEAPQIANTATVTASTIDEIAGDKKTTADLMRRSLERGTFDDALALAMQDSIFAAEVFQTVQNDPRFAALNNAPAQAGKSVTSNGRTPARAVARQGTRAQSGDVLDKTERKVQQANEKIDQAARIKRQADEATQKIDGIFGRK